MSSKQAFSIARSTIGQKIIGTAIPVGYKRDGIKKTALFLYKILVSRINLPLNLEFTVTCDDVL